MFCQNCGKEISDSATFCKECGAKVNSGVPEQSAAPAATVKKKSKVGVIIAACAGVVVVAAVITLLFVLDVFTPKAKIKDDILTMDSITFDFMDNDTDDGEVVMKKNALTDLQRSNGLVGDTYTIIADKNYDSPVKLTMKIPDECDGSDGEVVQLVAGLEAEYSDGSVGTVYSHIDPVIDGDTLTLEFIPSELSKLSEFYGGGNSAVPISSKNGANFHIEFGCFRGYIYLEDHVSYDGGYFKLYMPYKYAKDIQDYEDRGNTDNKVAPCNI